MTDITNAIIHMPIKYFWSDFETNDTHKGKLKKFDDWLELENPDYVPSLAFCFWLIFELRVSALPAYIFYISSEDNPSDIKSLRHVNLIRWAHCKTEDSFKRLDEALADWSIKNS